MNNKEICKYINSKDIRQHLLNIDYKFTTTEAAWLVNQCHSATLKEKIAAWRDIINTMPDESVNSPQFDSPVDSIHNVLKDYITMKEKMLELFFEESPKTFYQYMVNSTYMSTNYDDASPMSSYDICYKYLKRELNNEYKDQVGDSCIRRSEIDGLYNITAYYSYEGELMDVYIPSDYGIFDWLLSDFFDNLWFHFPVPYKKGDILYDPFHPNRSDCPGPVVMEGITPLQFEKDGRKHTDSSDMVVWGYFQDKDSGTLYHEVTWNYMDYEYFPNDQLTGKRRIFKALSNLIKEQISLDLFTRAYHLIILEEAKNDIIPHGWYTDEGLQRAGIVEDPDMP
ncbi:hypothetical protein SAMN05216349_1526 [Oribacterium sp. KHPX15]|uniref:hypothetical protein n=1 Tax=Oribacterium sp. KHPX15 TaxID=1855342 RepID=UPI00089CFDF8|nr:hypothetical protein [Oribacterium sp. KHPX15]SEA91480.1 hypothetical protein SAMN05216349_1526 [Oribacterium sp. KHPX15]